MLHFNCLLIEMFEAQFSRLSRNVFLDTFGKAQYHTQRAKGISICSKGDIQEQRNLQISLQVLALSL